MKKWLPICLFLTIITSLSLCASANFRQVTNKRFFHSQSQGITIAQTHLSAADSQQKKDADIVFYNYHGIHSLFNVSSNALAEPDFYFTLSQYGPGEFVHINHVETEVSDHLLHLFPSHYFW